MCTPMRLCVYVYAYRRAQTEILMEHDAIKNACFDWLGKAWKQHEMRAHESRSERLSCYAKEFAFKIEIADSRLDSLDL